MKILHIDSSISGRDSVSRALTGAIVGRFSENLVDPTVVYLDLAEERLPHLSGATLAQMAAQGGGDPMDDVSEDAGLSKRLLDEFLDSDVVVIGAPMYNFGVPSCLKAWIDRIVIAGRTFRYTPGGPVGLVEGKRVVVASSRGGYYASGTAGAAFDHQENFLRAIFGFIGISETEFVRAEGVALGNEEREKAISAAMREIAILRV